MNDFRGRPLPEPAKLAGYAALIGRYDLRSAVAKAAGRHRRTTQSYFNSRGGFCCRPRHQPAQTLGGDLKFALKYEGLDLIVLAALFRAVEARDLEGLFVPLPKAALHAGSGFSTNG